MTTDKAALVVVDVQNGFITPDSAPVVPIVADLVRNWLAADRGPLVFTRYFNYPGSPYERLIGWYGLHDPAETSLVPELESYAIDPHTHVLDKQVYTAFTPEGAELFVSLGAKDLYICGIATDGCVLKTTLDAFELGYTPWVLADACASNATRVPAQEVHRNALLLMSRLVGAGQVISTSDVVY